MKFLKKKSIVELKNIVGRNVMDIVLDYHNDIHYAHLDILKDKEKKKKCEYEINYYKYMINRRKKELNGLQIKRPEIFE